MCKKPRGTQTVYWAITYNILSICRKLSNAARRGSPEDFAQHKQSLSAIIHILQEVKIMPIDGRDGIVEALEQVKQLPDYETKFLGKLDVQKTIDYLKAMKVTC